MPDITKIKANVGRMIDQNAPEADIAAYLASEGTTVQDLRGARMEPADEQAYTALAADPKSTASDIQAFARQRGFDVTDADASDFITRRPGVKVVPGVTYQQLPKAPPSARDEMSGMETASAAAGSFMDGMLPGAGKFMAGVGGVVGNAIAAPFSDQVDFDPAGAFSREQAASVEDGEQFAEENPNTDATLGWTGLAAGLALPGANIARSGSLGAGVANGALTGLAYGTATGALNDSGDGRLANAATSGAVGLALGGAAAPAIRAGSSVLEGARRNIPGVDATANFLAGIPSRLRGNGPLPASGPAHAQAERMLAEQMDGSRTIATGMGTGTVPSTPQNVAAEVAARQARGVPAMPADTAEDLRQTTAWALQGRGTMTTRARQELMGRQAQAGPRVRQHLTDELGPAVDPIAEVEAIRRRASAASGPGYRAAYAQPVAITDEMAGIMQTPAFQEALPAAVRNIRNAQGNPQALGFRVHDNGDVEIGEQLSTEGFDQVIRAMRDSGRAAAEINPATGQVINNTNSIHINDRARDLRDQLGQQNEPYREVTANYADEMALRDAMVRGGDVAKTTGPLMEAQMRNMPDHAQEAYMAGARTSLMDRATQASLKPTANVTQRVRQDMGFSGAGSHAAPGDPGKLQALETMSGRPGVMNRLDDRLEAEDQAYKTFSEAYGNSKTQPRQALDEAMSGEALGMVQKVATGNIAGAVASVLFHGNPRGTLRFKRDVQDRISQIMTATEPRTVQELMAAVTQRAETDREFGALLNRAGVQVSKLAASQIAGQDTDPLPLELEDGQVLLGFQNDETTDHLDAPIYGKLGTHYPPSH